MISLVSSWTGPSKTCTISPTSKRRTALASLIFSASVRMTSLTTFIITDMTASNAAADTEPLRSSSKLRKARRKSSSVKADTSSPSTLGSFTAKAARSSASKQSASSCLMLANSSAVVNLLSALYCFKTSIAFSPRALTSPASFLDASTLNLSVICDARVQMASKPFRLTDSFRFSVSCHFCNSSAMSLPSDVATISFSTSAISAWDALMDCSTSAARSNISVDFIPFALMLRVVVVLLSSWIAFSTSE
mmetsp:Transcript_44233/g.87854  ORF Transcript_44233/g.87854 Transcript_44233/m.87854 type:complete len:249 (-) Transcript_44233:142-888(-)